MTNLLYYGDNLGILREHVRDESVDLVYLDPPFNSKANYNILFRTPKGLESSAQINAFEDTWHWGEQAEREFTELVRQSNTDVSEVMQALRRFMGENDMMAYLTMIANRLLELHRVLKGTGSLYLHCDPTASHYLKVVLDSVFGKGMFVNEIVWKRSGRRSSMNRIYRRAHDVIFLYGKTDSYKFHLTYEAFDETLLQKYNQRDERGVYQLVPLMVSGTRNGVTGKPWRGFDPNTRGKSGMHWVTTHEKLDAYAAQGLVEFPKKPDGTPRLKYYLEQNPGVPLSDFWDDIDVINSMGNESLGYPTQKPLALLERIISASSDEGDTVLDPFCGCGTAIHAAQKLNRAWMGVDITHLAVSLVEKRLRDAFPGVKFEVRGTPQDLDSARDLADRDKYQFQWWACSLVNAQPFQGMKKGADSGIDGVIYFQDDQSAIDRRKSVPKKIVVSVKGGEHVGVPLIRELAHVVDREKAEIGLFVTLAQPTRPMKEEAVKAGYYSSPTGADFPKIQILTVEGLLSGTEQPRYPDLTRGGLMFRRAKKEVKEKQHALPSLEGHAARPKLPGRGFLDSPLLDALEEEKPEGS